MATGFGSIATQIGTKVVLAAALIGITYQAASYMPAKAKTGETTQASNTVVAADESAETTAPVMLMSDAPIRQPTIEPTPKDVADTQNEGQQKLHSPLANALIAQATPTAPASDAYVIKRILDTGGPLKFGEHFWDTDGVPAGEIVITVDLKAQVLSIFKGGYEIGTAAILFGSDEKPTPTGVFPITQKSADHVSNIYGTPMPYMLRMTNDGISVHGSDVEYGYVTHGCIGIPTEFAKKIFGVVKLGDKVIVTDGETLSAGEAIGAA